ncbi:Ca2-permeable cation channel protein, partial [Globisporangium splendens]
MRFDVSISSVAVVAIADNIPDFELVVFQESLYSTAMWRKYNLRITLMSIVGPQVCIRWIRFARGNLTLGPFARMIFKMFEDIVLFLMVFGLFLCGFGFAFFILQLEGCKTYFTALSSVFQISLGAWDWDVIYEGGPIAILFFIAYAVIDTIMLLNLLIAVRAEYTFVVVTLQAKATISIQTALNDNEHDERYWCQQLYVLEGDTPIEGIQFQKF